MRAALIALLLLTACASRPGDSTQVATPVIQHVVIIWLQQSGNPAHRHQVIEASRRLAEIPGIEAVSVGAVIPSDRPVVDSSFDVGLLITFSDPSALTEYVDHPIHQSMLRDTIRPLVDRYRVYDFAE